jgi:hypothetical protein
MESFKLFYREFEFHSFPLFLAFIYSIDLLVNLILEFKYVSSFLTSNVFLHIENVIFKICSKIILLKFK